MNFTDAIALVQSNSLLAKDDMEFGVRQVYELYDDIRSMITMWQEIGVLSPRSVEFSLEKSDGFYGPRWYKCPKLCLTLHTKFGVKYVYFQPDWDSSQHSENLVIEVRRGLTDTPQLSYKGRLVWRGNKWVHRRYYWYRLFWPVYRDWEQEYLELILRDAGLF